MGCHYTVSRPMDIEELLAIIRGNWRVLSCRENGLHRVLNMQVRDDCSLHIGRVTAVMDIL
ncbi:MAG: hypothetical protein OXC13_15205 [Caldilineaceae bacterium]|nr:hypothetical protein [Caldilineaceae bacterium]